MLVLVSDRLSPASATVVDHLEGLIFDGNIAPGESLPSESQLVTLLGVSRLTVREGVRMLQARGVINVAHGRRPTVAFPSAQPLREFFSSAVRRDVRGMLDLVEVRIAIEVHAAELAALNATRSDLAALDSALGAMRSSAGDGVDESDFNDADVRFHAAVASASGNRMIDFLVESMEEPLQYGRAASVHGHRARSGSLNDLLDIHTHILEAIRRRAPQEAARLMRAHLDETRVDINAAFGNASAASASSPRNE